MVSVDLKKWVALIVAFSLGLSLGLALSKIARPKELKITDFYIKRLYPSDGHHTNPMLLVEKPQGGDTKLAQAKQHMHEYIDKALKSGDADAVSVYLRDIDKGNWVGINEEMDFSEASLIKVPLLMAYLKIAEKYPAILAEQILYKAENKSVPQNIIPEKTIQPGNTYAVDELLRYMIVHSDNAATDLLFNNINPKLMDDLYSSLGVNVVDNKVERFISAKGYASFFRVLYSVTYLDLDMSEKALNLLLESEFKDGIVAGIPPGIAVAHKFAERAYTNSPEKQLHDGGIIYYEGYPYLLCVMTKGKNVSILKTVIRDISKIAYDEISAKGSLS
jgi:beta-lactamase class A